MKEEMLIRIARQVCHIPFEDMTTSEKNIASILQVEGYVKQGEDKEYRPVQKSKEKR